MTYRDAITAKHFAKILWYNQIITALQTLYVNNICIYLFKPGLYKGPSSKSINLIKSHKSQSLWLSVQCRSSELICSVIRAAQRTCRQTMHWLTLHFARLIALLIDVWMRIKIIAIKFYINQISRSDGRKASNTFNSYSLELYKA